MNKEKTARLVLRSKDKQTYETPGRWSVNVNMGNVVTNVDDVYYLQLEHCTPITYSGKNDGGIDQISSPIEISVDVPHFASYDSHTQTQTHHLCFMEREPTQVQTQAISQPGDIFEPGTLQTWRFQKKLAPIVVKPEVLQCKTWHITAKFLDDIDSADDIARAPDTAYCSQYALVFSITK